MSETPRKRIAKKERVSWTSEELKSVIDAAAIISLDDTQYVWTYLLKAQSEVLPPNRQRRIQGSAVVTDEILRMFIEARAVLLDHNKKNCGRA